MTHARVVKGEAQVSDPLEFMIVSEKLYLGNTIDKKPGNACKDGEETEAWGPEPMDVVLS